MSAKKFDHRLEPQSRATQTDGASKEFSSRRKAILKVNGYPVNFSQDSTSRGTLSEEINPGHSKPTSITFIAHWTGSHPKGNQFEGKQQDGFKQKSQLRTFATGGQTEGLLHRFVQQLKQRYKDMYTSVQPIPYIREKLYSVDRVFVEGGINELCDNVWKKLASYQSILPGAVTSDGKLVIVIGDPGYGKTTLSLQFAFDWCQDGQDSLKSENILILLHLRQLGGITSIYQAIQQFLLPKSSHFSANDIKNILQRGKPGVIILDGFDEYPDYYLSSTFVQKIILKEMFENFHVLLTSRFTPSFITGQMRLLRLTGFDKNARDSYIHKVVAVNDSGAVEEIKRSLEQNIVLNDLCQVPLLFVMFAHMSYERQGFENVKTVTNFFQHIVACFHNHMRVKMDDTNVQICNLYDANEKEHSRLDKIAFQGFLEKPQQLVWNYEVLCDKLGQDFLDQYMKIGVLVVDDLVSDVKERFPEPSTKIRFYHKLFQEWYAAFHFMDCIKYHDDLTNLTANIPPSDVQYLYRFACGLADSEAADKIIKHLQSDQEKKLFSILCLAERRDDYISFRKSVEEICSNRVEFENYQSNFLQRSTIQLLKIASSSLISIEMIVLKKCFSSVECPAETILLRGNCCIPVLATVKNIEIDEKSRKMTEEEIINIVEFSSKCTSLGTLCFKNCLMPPKISSDKLTRHDLNVEWCSMASNEECFQLNLLTGKWEVNGKEISCEKYKKVKYLFSKMKIRTHEKRRISLEEKKLLSVVGEEQYF